MESHDKSIYASTPFKFIIDGNPIYIHADLVSHHSKPLDRLMNGHMAEAQEEFAVLEDVDEETFVRFVEWAYSGHYSAPDFVYDSSSDGPKEVVDAVGDPALEASENEEFLWPTPVVQRPHNGRSFDDAHGRKVSKKSKKFSPFDEEPTTGPSLRDTMRESFVSHKTTVRRESIAIPPPRPNQDPHEDYTNIFLFHARLHVFADKFDIQELRSLALEELHTTLASFTLYSERTGDIIKLLHYIYENCGESLPGVEDLRTLITQYVGFEMDTLMKDESFKGLMIDDGGPLLGDFMHMVLKRI